MSPRAPRAAPAGAGAGPLARAWQATATAVLSTLVLLVALNVVLWGAFALLDRGGTAASDAAAPGVGPGGPHFTPEGAPVDNGRRTDWQLRWVDFGAYAADADPARAAAVLDDFHALAQLGFVYQPWVQFSEPPFAGRFVHVDVDARGRPYRRSVAPPQPLDARPVRILTFGGSTTFGYSVADADTWPSALAHVLSERARRAGLVARIELRNYGRGYYNPGQELALLVDLLRDGARPDLVIFMDGVNWGPEEDVPYFTPEIARAFHRAQFPERPSLLAALSRVPMVRLARRLRDALAPAPDADAPDGDPPPDADAPDGDPPPEAVAGDAEVEAARVREAVARFEGSRRMAAAIAEEAGVEALFFLQPDALHDYPLERYRTSPPAEFLQQRRLHARFHETLPVEGRWIDLGPLLTAFGSAPKPILDDLHYGPPFNRFLAEAVADHVDLEALLAAGGGREEAGPSGSVRATPPFGP